MLKPLQLSGKQAQIDNAKSQQVSVTTPVQIMNMRMNNGRRVEDQADCTDTDLF